MLTGRDIICLSTIDWDFIWQGHQEIMATLAGAGNRVLYVENTGVRPPRIRDLPRLRSRMRNWSRGVKGFRQERQNLFVYSPLLLPFPYSRLARAVNRRLLARALNRWMRATGARRPIVWTFLPTPLARDVIQSLDPALTVYYCIDDFASSSTAARRIERSENALFRAADLVFVTSTKLRERAQAFRERVDLFPFGVNYGEFEHVRKGHDELPPELRALSRPIVGYVGGLHRWVDQDLLGAVAERMPEVSFALIGPAQTDVAALARRPNVHLLGARPHAELPHYIKGFDVGVVPYRLTDYTANVYPTKLNEYLAMGIPVVATTLPEITRFNAEHDAVVTESAHDPDAFVAALRTALADDAPARTARRIEAARSNGWDMRISRMAALMEEALWRKERDAVGWQPALSALYRRARRRLGLGVAGLTVAYVLFFQTALLWGLGRPLMLDAAAKPAGAIVVLGGGVGESGEAGGGYQERVQRAVELYQTGMAPRIVFSSGFQFTFREADVMRELAIGRGVPAAAIDVETAAASTADNVRNVLPILARHGVRDVLLVSSPYHMRRGVLTWRRLAPGVAVTPAPVRGSQFYTAHQTAPTLQQLRGFAHEYAALVAYWLRGWV
ncbi:MAG: YdcF family protein [Candidatus Rokubacteria bacterium]|nr:YdcF family protein [Candidatus Rokubacteria bacterium]